MFVEQYFEHRTNTEHVHLLAIEHPFFAFDRTNIELRTLFDPSLHFTSYNRYLKETQIEIPISVSTLRLKLIFDRFTQNWLKMGFFFRQKWRIFVVRRFGNLTEQFGRTCSAIIDRRFGRTVWVRSYTTSKLLVCIEKCLLFEIS